MKPIKPFQYSQEIHGVSVKPLTESGKEVQIKYNGILASSGAAGLSMHFGYGNSGEWKNVGTVDMDRTYEGWAVTVPMHEYQLNFCFKDTANNWDNNSGLNWIYRIS